MFTHELNSKNASLNGEKAELRFARIMKYYRYTVIKPTLRQDKREHFDWKVITRKGKEYRVDVKAIKRVDRSKPKQEAWYCMEMKNRLGYLGWLYGDAEYIAFEFSDGFYLVEREPLLKKSEALAGLKTSQFTLSRAKKNKKPYQLYKPYTRPGNVDVIMYITKKDLLSVNNIIIKDYK